MEEYVKQTELENQLQIAKSKHYLKLSLWVLFSPTQKHPGKREAPIKSFCHMPTAFHLVQTPVSPADFLTLVDSG